jgi:hypothetical protein
MKKTGKEVRCVVDASKLLDGFFDCSFDVCFFCDVCFDGETLKTSIAVSI